MLACPTTRRGRRYNNACLHCGARAINAESIVLSGVRVHIRTLAFPPPALAEWVDRVRVLDLRPDAREAVLVPFR